MVTFGSFVLQSGFIYVFSIHLSRNTIAYPTSPHPIPPSLYTLLRTEKTQEGLVRTRTKNELRNVEKFKKYLVRRVDRLTYQLLSRPPLSPPPIPFRPLSTPNPRPYLPLLFLLYQSPLSSFSPHAILQPFSSPFYLFPLFPLDTPPPPSFRIRIPPVSCQTVLEKPNPGQ